MKCHTKAIIVLGWQQQKPQHAKGDLEGGQARKLIVPGEFDYSYADSVTKIHDANSTI